MGNTPLSKGKFHTGYFSRTWETTQHMKKRKEYQLNERHWIIQKLAVLIFSSRFGNNLKALCKAAKVGETTVRDILVRTNNPGIDKIDKILKALGKDWKDILDETAISPSDPEFQLLLEDAVKQLATQMRDGRKNKIKDGQYVSANRSSEKA